jgi:hypothetical protein
MAVRLVLKDPMRRWLGQLDQGTRRMPQRLGSWVMAQVPNSSMME